MDFKDKMSMLKISVTQAVIDAISSFVLVYAIVRNFLQEASIDDYRYNIGEEFKVQTLSLLIGSIVVLVVTNIISKVLKDSSMKIKESGMNKNVPTDSQTTMFADCPNGGEANTVNSEYSFKPNQKSSSRPRSHSNENQWVCPVCGKENQNYVGTCGCGTRKP